MFNRLAPHLLNGTVRALSWLSLRRAHQLGARLGRLLWRMDVRLAKTGRKNIERCFPQLSEQEQTRLSRSSLEETGKFGTESGMIVCWEKKRWLALIKKVSGWEQFEEAAAAGRSVLILAPHFGSWELFNLYAGSRLDLTVVYKPPDLPSLDPIFTRVRERSGATLMPANAAGIKAMYRALSAGRVAGLLPDQVPDPSAGIVAPFFGCPALTMTFAHRLIRATKPVVLFCYASRLKDGQGYEIGINAASEAVYDKDPLTCVTGINKAVETIVRVDPAQYQWEYKRFKLPRDRRS